MSGIRGGFFTIGINGGYKKFILEKLFLATGLHIGAGGGVAAEDGGGAFILPHLNLGYQFKNFAISTGYSYVNFFDEGKIRSSQLNIELQIPFNFDYAYHE